MIKRILTLFFISCTTGMSVFSQNVMMNVILDSAWKGSGRDTIYYDGKIKLTWDDFKGIPDMNSAAGAMTGSGFSYNWDGIDDGSTVIVNVTIRTFFLKQKSWKKPQIQSAYHLRHEQIHFDITWLGALKFMTELKNAQYTAANYARTIKQIFDKVYQENIKLQHQYDEETKNSRDSARQEEWNKKIRLKLLQNIVR